MASGQTEFLKLPQIIGTDFVNSNDINNGFYKIDQNAQEVKARITAIETEDEGTAEELEGISNTIQEMRDDLLTIQGMVTANTESATLLTQHLNEATARITALEGAGSGGNIIKAVAVNLNNNTIISYGSDLSVTPFISRANIKTLIKNTYDYNSVDDFELTFIPQIIKKTSILLTGGASPIDLRSNGLLKITPNYLVGSSDIDSISLTPMKIESTGDTYISNSQLTTLNNISFYSPFTIQCIITVH